MQKGIMIAAIIVAIMAIMLGRSDAHAQKINQSSTFTAVKLFPVDETQQNPDLKHFVDEFRQAIQDKNHEFLLKHVDGDITCDFGGGSGIAYFTQYWKLDRRPQASPVWKILRDIVSLGGTVSTDGGSSMLVFPYVFTKFPSEFDAFQYGAITGEHLNVREAPSLTSPVVTQLSYDVVRLIYVEKKPTTTINGEEYPWEKIMTAEGLIGYVYGKYVRSPIDYRAGFVKKEGEWKMTFFLAGD